MPIFKAPTGDTTASRVKTLVLYVERLRGRREADAFLNDVGVSRDMFSDETRPVSVAIWARALEQFNHRYGAAAIEASFEEVVHPANLGPWIHLVRNANTVADAYQLLEAPSTQMSSTTRVETRSVREGEWRGRLHILHDPALENGGLLAAARRAELMAVPTLFGLPPAVVREVATLEKDGFFEYKVTWTSADTGAFRWWIPVASTLTFAAAGAILSGLWGSIVLSVVGVLAGSFATRLYRSELVRRAQVFAQSMRIRALERSLELQEQPDMQPAGDLDGSVIAGLYRLRARLGAGATGVIYEALRLSDQAPVAIKLLRAAVAQDAVASDRLRREAEALRLTWHSNVVELYDHGHLPDGSSYIVMELLKGETLATRLSRQKRLLPSELVPLVDQICDALTAVHAAGVIHRDLKPSNIYLCEAKHESSHGGVTIESPRVKIFDFGIARVEWAETRITNMGVPLGTPGYMAPEQEAGETVDHRSDIYALGALVYECLTGNPPPLHGRVSTEGGAASPARWHIAPTTGSTVPPKVEEGWRLLVDRAMARRPQDRYPDARALGAAMHALTEGHGSSGTIPKARKAFA